MALGLDSRAELRGLPDDVLIAEAAAGNMRAASEYLSRHVRMLEGMSRRIGSNVLDAEDLLSDAVMGLLRKWLDGTGPTEAVNAYLIRSMRNRVIDELRSPRSRETSLELMNPPTDDGDFERVERRSDLSVVRAAIMLLPEDQRTVLLESEVNGRAPRDLVSTLGRSAPAISSLLRRAKMNLRTTILRSHLDEQGPPTSDECEHVLQALPFSARTPEEVASHYQRHGRECERCARGVATFGVTIAGLLSALVLVAIDPRVTPVAAADAPREPGAEKAARAPWGASRRVMLAAGAAAVVAGGIIVASTIVTPLMTSPGSSPLQGVNASGTPTTSGVLGNTLDIGFHVAVDASSWQLDHVTIATDEATGVARVPAGWDCEWTAPVLQCTAVRDSVRGGEFGFEVAPSVSTADYVVRIAGHTDDLRFTGESTLQILREH